MNTIGSPLMPCHLITIGNQSNHWLPTKRRVMNACVRGFDTNLLIESKLACNLGTWNTSLIQIRLTLSYTIVCTAMESTSMASSTLLSTKSKLRETITSYVLNATVNKIMCWRLLNPRSTCIRSWNMLHYALQMCRFLMFLLFFFIAFIIFLPFIGPYKQYGIIFIFSSY